MKKWKGQRYYPVSQYYQKLFGEKVFKVSVNVANGCPDKKQTGQNSRCIYCDQWGAAAYHIESHLPLREQIQKNREKIRTRYKANKFLVYFQAYTNTFNNISLLKNHIYQAIEEENICGIVIATRPDCISDEPFKVFNELSQKTYISIELGVQSFFDKHLNFLNRGHSVYQSISAINKIYKNCKIDICIHLIFGLLNEREEEIIETAKIINNLPITSVKLHNLHILRKTSLAMIYKKGDFIPLELEDYAKRVLLFLRYLSPEIAIQRLTAVANRWEDLVAPEWTKKKMEPVQFICNLMNKNKIYQGMDFNSI